MAVPTLTVRVDWTSAGTFSSTVNPDRVQFSRGASADYSGEAIGSMTMSMDSVQLDSVKAAGNLVPGKPVHAYATYDHEATTEGIVGLVSYWRLGEVAGTNAVDTFGGRTGTYVNTPTLGVAGAITGDSGTAVLFTAASSEYVTVPDHASLDLGDTWSVSAWVKLASVTSVAARHILSKGPTAYALRVNTAGAIEMTKASTSVMVTSTTVLTTAWHHVVATKNGSTLKIYIDGIDRTGTVTNATTLNNTDALLIGADDDVGAGPIREFMDGTLDEVALFNVALPATDVRALYRAGVGNALFYGFIERITPDPESSYVTITCYDPLRRMAETDIVVPANSYAAHSARTMRRAVLEDFERGTRNLIANPSFETNTTGWTQTGTSLTRTATDAAPDAGSAYGAFIASAADQRAYTYARMAPIFFEGEVYRFSVWLKVASGTETWKVGLGTTLGADANERSVTVTTSWQRFTATYMMTADQTGSGANPLVGWVESTAAGTVRIDAAAITRGQALYPYSDTGTGRWPNWVGNGDFEGYSAAIGWYHGWKNLIPNDGFEVDTTGWASGVAATVAATSFTRSTSDPKFGVGRAALVMTATANSGREIYASETVLAGVTYDWGVAIKNDAVGSIAVQGGILDGTNPGDISVVSSNVDNNGYALFTGIWTPANNTAFGSLFVRNNSGSVGTLRIDGAYLYRRDGPALTRYVGPGPGGGGSAPTLYTIPTNAGKYGYQALNVTTPATANAGVVYDFNHYGPMFVSGQQYILSLWVYPSSNMPYKVGIGADKADGTWDEASTTGTATANVWTQITRTWTPSADRNSDTALEAVIFLYQTDATARDFRVDGVRVVPGGTADDFEMTQWDLDNAGGEATDRYLATASFSGSALSALSTLNTLTLSRHWIRPTMASPWYTYVSEDRVTFAAKAVTQTFSGTANEFTDVELDREGIKNVVPVTWDDGAEFYSDSDSVGAYGQRLAGRINGADFFGDRTIPDIIGPALVTRYKDPHERPALTLENNFPAQLSLDLNDVIAVTIVRFGLSAVEYVILREELSIDEGARNWVTTYRLETFPY